MARAKITYAAPKWRDPITDSQVMLFCRLVDDIAERFRGGSVPSPTLPEYQRLLLGAEACGFVCCDLTANLIVLGSADRAGWVRRANFKELRLYIHSLVRAERRFQKNPSDKVQPLQAALVSGTLLRVCCRLRSEDAWRGL